MEVAYLTILNNLPLNTSSDKTIHNTSAFSHKVINILKSIQTIILLSLTILICAIILIFPEYSSNGVKKGLFFCSDILIPSLFPFMVISSFIVKSNLSVKIGKFMNPITKFLFHLPGCTGPTILLGLIGGYPTSARGIKSLFDKGDINDSQAERMLYFSIGAGPGFVISFIGSKLLNNSKCGIIILISQVIASIFIGILTGLFCKNDFRTNKNCNDNKEKVKLSCAFINSCSEACYGLINLCSLVVVFSVLILILDSTSISEEISDIFLNIGLPKSSANSILPIFLEVTSGCVSAANQKAPIELISFALGWAGLCVHFQIFSSLQGIKFSIIKFMSFRFIHGLLASLLTHILLKIIPIEIEVISNTTKQLSYSTYSDYASCIALILLSVFFVLSINPEVSKINIL